MKMILGDPCDRNDIWHVCLKSKKKFTCFAKKNCKEILVLNSDTISMCIFFCHIDIDILYIDIDYI